MFHFGWLLLILSGCCSFIVHPLEEGANHRTKLTIFIHNRLFTILNFSFPIVVFHLRQVFCLRLQAALSLVGFGHCCSRSSMFTFVFVVNQGPAPVSRLRLPTAAPSSANCLPMGRLLGASGAAVGGRHETTFFHHGCLSWSRVHPHLQSLMVGPVISQFPYRFVWFAYGKPMISPVLHWLK